MTVPATQDAIDAIDEGIDVQNRQMCDEIERAMKGDYDAQFVEPDFQDITPEDRARATVRNFVMVLPNGMTKYAEWSLALAGWRSTNLAGRVITADTKSELQAIMRDDVRRFIGSFFKV